MQVAKDATSDREMADVPDSCFVSRQQQKLAWGTSKTSSLIVPGSMASQPLQSYNSNM